MRGFSRKAHSRSFRRHLSEQGRIPVNDGLRKTDVVWATENSGTEDARSSIHTVGRK
jgi:hypothetical protein